MEYYNKNPKTELIKYNKHEYFEEWYNIVEKILKSDEFQRRKLFLHHDNSVWDHSIDVSFQLFVVTKTLKLDYKNAAIAGLLHDFYPDAWQYNENLEKLDKKYLKKFHKNNKKLTELHGFIHAKTAAKNAKKYYKNLINKKVYSAIETHMFPLNLAFPKSVEAWLLTLVDKKVSINILTNFSKLPKYVGINSNK